MANIRKSELTPQDKIGLTAVEVLGRDYAEAAFRLARKIRTHNKQSFETQLSRWLNSDKAKAFRMDIKKKISKEAVAEGADLRTRDGVLSELIYSVKATTGKDSVSGLQTLAKMQGFDKPDGENGTKDRRVYFLPWVSHCRSCALMKAYIESKSKP